MIYDSLRSTGYISTLKKFRMRDMKDKSKDQYIGLQMLTGVVYRVNTNDLTVDIGIDFGDRPAAQNAFEGRPTITAMLLHRKMASQFSFTARPELFVSDASIPPVGSQVVFAYLNGNASTNVNAVCFGCINPLATSYNYRTLEQGIEQAFETLQALSYTRNEAGYYEYQNRDGDNVRGKVNIAQVPYRKVWEQTDSSDGSFVRRIFDNTGENETSAIRVGSNGSVNVTIGQNTSAEISNAQIRLRRDTSDVTLSGNQIQLQRGNNTNVTLSDTQLQLQRGVSTVTLSNTQIRMHRTGGGTIEC